MPVIEVVGPDTVVRHMLAAELAACGCEVVLVDGDATVVTARVEGSSRWICIELSREPGRNGARAVAEGAAAVVTLGSSPEEFMRALRVLFRADDESFVAADLLQWMANQSSGIRPPNATDQNRQLLTARETEVLRCVALGMSNCEIADALSVTVSTVRTHLQAVAAKLGLKRRAEIMVYASRRGGLLNPSAAA